MTGFYVLVEQHKDCHFGDVLLYNELQNLIVKLCQKVIKDLNLNRYYKFIYKNEYTFKLAHPTHINPFMLVTIRELYMLITIVKFFKNCVDSAPSVFITWHEQGTHGQRHPRGND